MGTSYGSTHTRAKAGAEYIMKLKSDVASNETFEGGGGNWVKFIVNLHSS